MVLDEELKELWGVPGGVEEDVEGGESADLGAVSEQQTEDVDADGAELGGNAVGTLEELVELRDFRVEAILGAGATLEEEIGDAQVAGG